MEVFGTTEQIYKQGIYKMKQVRNSLLAFNNYKMVDNGSLME
jgi:hypothetical protein